ncbi:MAG: hypothetical protein HRT77_15500 [Halioglobus sp.]|nr:hypothetical protein [Halioglobus sp.]
MYRYTNDNAVTYTPDDVDLFRQSPFAAWMERLTLENPDHGILPDHSVQAPLYPEDSSAPLVDTLRAEGKQVATIDVQLDEAERREKTRAALHEGADFIANGQLAVGNFSASIHLLMRTSGYSNLGDFLYVPCEPEIRDGFHSGFRVAFTAHLLHTIQGQLPPQMLIIREGTDVVPLQTEDHIHYYWSVLKRFDHAMQNFRKHRMPDPAESSQFGRWSDCASEVLKQRAQSEQARFEDDLLQETETVEVAPLLVASGAGGAQEAVAPASGQKPTDSSNGTDESRARRADAGATLAEQASVLEPGHYSADHRPGHTPNLAQFSRVKAKQTAEPIAEEALSQAESPHEGDVDTVQERSSLPVPQVVELPVDATLENLEFIGSNGSGLSALSPLDASEAAQSGGSAPAATLRATVPAEHGPDALEALQDDQTALDLLAPAASLPIDETLELDEPLPADEAVQLPEALVPDAPGQGRDIPRFLPPDPTRSVDQMVEPAHDETAHESVSPPRVSVVDLDSAPAPTLVPVQSRQGQATESGTDGAGEEEQSGGSEPALRGIRPHPFDNRLNTSSDFADED